MRDGFFFFFQAEDGIRDVAVTGVQTCALPISNIDTLTLAWIFPAHVSAIKSTPLEVNGVLYFTTPDNVWAVDARYGRQIWHYQRVSEGDHIGNRGLGMYKKIGRAHV